MTLRRYVHHRNGDLNDNSIENLEVVEARDNDCVPPPTGRITTGRLAANTGPEFQFPPRKAKPQTIPLQGTLIGPDGLAEYCRLDVELTVDLNLKFRKIHRDIVPQPAVGQWIRYLPKPGRTRMCLPRWGQVTAISTQSPLVYHVSSLNGGNSGIDTVPYRRIIAVSTAEAGVRGYAR